MSYLSRVVTIKMAGCNGSFSLDRCARQVFVGTKDFKNSVSEISHTRYIYIAMSIVSLGQLSLLPIYLKTEFKEFLLTKYGTLIYRGYANNHGKHNLIFTEKARSAKTIAVYESKLELIREFLRRNETEGSPYLDANKNISLPLSKEIFEALFGFFATKLTPSGSKEK